MYRAREPLRIGLSLKNMLISKLLVKPVVWKHFTLSALGGLSFDLSASFRRKQTSFHRVQPDSYSSIPSANPKENKGLTLIAWEEPKGYKPVAIYLADPKDGYGLGAKPYIYLDFIPRELTYSPVSQFNSIGVVGVNNPSYHYGGSEDTLTFEIDWHGVRESESVIAKCRKIEALTKADGHRSPPRTIYIQWDRGGDLFKDHYFAVVSAPYRLEHFLGGRWTSHARPDIFTKTDNHYNPTRAIQTVTLKRVTSHSLTWEEMA